MLNANPLRLQTLWRKVGGTAYRRADD